MKRVAVEEPGYSLVRDQFQLNGFEILPISLGDKGSRLTDWSKVMQSSCT